MSSPDVNLVEVQICGTDSTGVIKESQIAVDPLGRTSGRVFCARHGDFRPGMGKPWLGSPRARTFSGSPDAADQVVYIDSVYEDLGGGILRQTQYSDFQGQR